MKDLTIKTYGHLVDVVRFNPGPSSCGGCDDLVWLDNGDGPWLIEFCDLERAYLAAREVRLIDGPKPIADKEEGRRP